MTTLRTLTIPTPGQSLENWLGVTWQAYTAAELESLFSRRQLQRGLFSGTVRRLAPNVYAGSAHADSFQTRVDAAFLWAGQRSAIGGAAALYLYGAIDSAPQRIEVVVDHRRRMDARPDWVRVRRVTYDAPVQNVGRWSVVAPAIAVCQGFGEMDSGARAGAVVRMVATQRVSVAQLAEALDALPRVRSRSALRRVVARCAAGVESFLEWHAVEKVFVGRPFDRFVLQHRVTAHGRQYRLDMYDDETRLAVEVDGANFHSGTQMWQRDMRRDTDLASLGIQTVRFNYQDLSERPEWCRERLLAVMAVRGPVA